jgi:hypothetical protein
VCSCSCDIDCERLPRPTSCVCHFATDLLPAQERNAEGAWLWSSSSRSRASGRSSVSLPLDPAPQTSFCWRQGFRMPLGARRHRRSRHPAGRPSPSTTTAASRFNSASSLMADSTRSIHMLKATAATARNPRCPAARPHDCDCNRDALPIAAAVHQHVPELQCDVPDGVLVRRRNRRRLRRRRRSSVARPSGVAVARTSSG